jgi:hypothetical protein
MIRPEQQRHHDALGGRYLKPDPTPRENPWDPKRRWWTRTRPLRCACGVVFFGFEPADAPLEPYFETTRKDGSKLTCGHPNCLQSEARDQLRLMVHGSRGLDEDVLEVRRGARLQKRAS